MNERRQSTKTITVTALLMAMNIIMSTSVLSVPVPGGHMYLNDVIIVTAAVLLEPLYAFLVGGVGAFIGDMLFYPTPMFVSLAVHGLQALVISLFVHRWMKNRPLSTARRPTPRQNSPSRCCRRRSAPRWRCCCAGSAAW